MAKKSKKRPKAAAAMAEVVEAVKQVVQPVAQPGEKRCQDCNEVLSNRKWRVCEGCLKARAERRQAARKQAKTQAPAA
jgi:hypothetical protein